MKHLVVIGNGMAGVACVEQILKFNHDFRITIFGDETHVNYNRIMLSSVLAGEKSAEDIVINDIDWYQANNITPRLGVRITAIDAQAKTLTGSDDSVTPFDKLIIATGSSAFVPPMEGVERVSILPSASAMYSPRARQRRRVSSLNSQAIVTTVPERRPRAERAMGAVIAAEVP